MRTACALARRQELARPVERTVKMPLGLEQGNDGGAMGGTVRGVPVMLVMWDLVDRTQDFGIYSDRVRKPWGGSE